ncbi:MAG: hypothetical protein WB711_09005 [Terriglobales bacterium]
MSPSPINVVFVGKTHVVGMTMVPAGRRTVEGLLRKVVPLFQGVVPAAQVMLAPVVPGIPRASITVAE